MTGLIEGLVNLWSPVRRTGRPNAAEMGPARLSSTLNSGRGMQLDQMSQVGILFAIVDRLASSYSQIEWGLYLEARTGRPEDCIPVTNHLALDLWKQPNDFHSGMIFREMGQQHYELTGETWVVIDREEKYREIPLGMWTVRPDRIEPVPGEKTFLAGYIYTSDDGERIPLELDEVLDLKRPSPRNPYRGIGAVESVSAELQTSRAIAEWNRNFFRNGAIPNGIIEIPESLGDTDWKTLMQRWRESHRGTSRAHRVGTLEHGAKFVQNSYSPDDLMVTDLRTMTRDTVMEAFGISRHMLGITEDVNRANAKAGEYMYAKYMDKPRAIRARDMLNHRYLPLFNDPRPLFFDFENPVPEDEEAENAERESRAKTYQTYIDAGMEHEDACMLAGIPTTTRHTGSVPGARRQQQEA